MTSYKEEMLGTNIFDHAVMERMIRVPDQNYYVAGQVSIDATEWLYHMPDEYKDVAKKILHEACNRMLYQKTATSIGYIFYSEMSSVVDNYFNNGKLVPKPKDGNDILKGML